MKTSTTTRAAALALTLILGLLPQIGHCFFNPSTGRWLSRDPVEEKGGMNLYGFVHNDPADKLDRLGLTLTSDIPAEIANEIEAGVSFEQIAADFGLTLEQVAQMAAQLAAAKVVQQIAENLQNTATGKDPCEKAVDAIRQAKRSIRSFQNLINEHQRWISNPSSYPGGLQPPYDQHPDWAIRKWRDDIAKAKGNIDKYNKALEILQKAARDACRCWYKPWTWL